MTSTTARPTRRTLVRTAAWSVPVIAASAAAPAFASSCGVPYDFRLDWGTTPYTKDASTNVGTATVTGPVNSLPIVVTFTSTFSSAPDRRAADNLTVPPVTNVGGEGPTEQGLLISHASLGNSRATRQTVVISFSRPVSNLAFKITDVDGTTSWFDQVELTGPRTATYNSTYITGGGTLGNAWRPAGTNGDIAATSPNGNVAVLYTTAVTTITLDFWSSVAGTTQLIRLTDFAFSAVNC